MMAVERKDELKQSNTSSMQNMLRRMDSTYSDNTVKKQYRAQSLAYYRYAEREKGPARLDQEQ